MRKIIKDRVVGICIDCGKPTKRASSADYCFECQEKHRQESLTSQKHRQNAQENSTKRWRQVQFLRQNGLDEKKCKPVPQTYELVKDLQAKYGTQWHRHLPAHIKAFYGARGF